MGNEQPPRPTESELQILQVLWAAGPQSVRAVNERLNEERQVGYTTTLKIMQIMVEKGLLLRDTSSRTHIYRAAVAEKETQRSLLRNLADRAFRGSTGQLIMQALGNHRASAEELNAIKALIERLEEDNKDEDE